MKDHPYEYKVLVEYINPEQRGKTVHFTHEENQESFTSMLGDVVAHMSESIPEGWEVNSHNVMAARDTIIVTILLRRLRGK